MLSNSGLSELEKKKLLPIYSSGDKFLDELLLGGFHSDLIYLLYGDKRLIATIMQKTAVLSFRSEDYKNRVAFIDCNNRFNPYNISKLAVAQGLSPVKVLTQIMISRAFTWEGLVEALENRIDELENVKIIIVSGITTLWPNYDQITFEGLHHAISGIKAVIFKSNPVIILTAPLHIHSKIKPQGGKILTHFGNVLVLINSTERYIEYQLIQHPSLPEKQIISRFPLKPKRGLKKPLENTTIDQWI